MFIGKPFVRTILNKSFIFETVYSFLRMCVVSSTKIVVEISCAHFPIRNVKKRGVEFQTRNVYLVRKQFRVEKIVGFVTKSCLLVCELPKK